MILYEYTVYRNTVEKKYELRFRPADRLGKSHVLQKHIVLCVRPVHRKCLADIYFYSRYTR